jgi:hypothetical protein
MKAMKNEVMYLQDKECQKLLVWRETWNRFSLRPQEGNNPLAPEFQTSGLQNYERRNL